MEAGRIADTAFATWRAIAAALAPIIGQRGVAALYKRSLYLTRTDYPWLEAIHEAEGLLTPADFAALQAALSRQTATEAAAASGALMQNFHALLTSLIGPSLTERLLRSACEHPSSGAAAQDTPP